VAFTAFIVVMFTGLFLLPSQSLAYELWPIAAGVIVYAAIGLLRLALPYFTE
jgi:hypothetical protein